MSEANSVAQPQSGNQGSTPRASGGGVLSSARRRRRLIGAWAVLAGSAIAGTALFLLFRGATLFASLVGGAVGYAAFRLYLLLSRDQRELSRLLEQAQEEASRVRQVGREPQRSAEELDTGSSGAGSGDAPDARLRVFCDVQRQLPSLNAGLHMPALAAAYMFWMSGHWILAFVAAGLVEAITLAIASAARNAMNQAFVYRAVRPRPYHLSDGRRISAQVVDVLGDNVLLRVTQDKYGNKGHIQSFPKADLSAEDRQYVESILVEVEKREAALRPPTAEEQEAKRLASVAARQAEQRQQQENQERKEHERLAAIAATLSDSERMCANCGAKYTPSDYNPDAPEWHCSACKSVLAR